MRFSFRIISLVATFAVAVVHGGEAEINLQTWDGESALPGGWTQTRLKKSSTYNDGAQFSGAEYSLTTPQFGYAILSVSVKLTCSASNPERILKLIPVNPDGTEGDALSFDSPALAKNYETQVKDIELLGVDQFRIGVSSGRTGYWYVLSVKVAYDEGNPTVRLDPVELEPLEEPCLVSNCWKVSEFTKVKGGKCIHDADFSYLATVKKETDWVNGVSIDSFYSFDAGTPSTRIKNATASSTYHGLYAIHTNDEHGVISALGLLPSGDAAMEMLLPVELDAEKKIRGVTVAYRCWQPKIGTAKTTLSFSWCAAGALAEINKAGWVSATEGDYSGGSEDSLKSVEIAGRTFKGARFLCFKWSVPKQANSSLLGISDLRVTTDCSQPGFAVQIR